MKGGIIIKIFHNSMAVLLAFILVFGAVPLFGISSQYFDVVASALTLGNLTYEVAGGEVTITDCNQSASGAITIPPEIDAFPVTAIGNYALESCTSISSVTIPAGVTYIGDYAFENCTSLTGITMPESVKKIGYQAFYDCTSLASISIPEGASVIEDEAFLNCTSLANISIPSSVTYIGESLFSNTAYYNNPINWTSDVLYIDSCLIEAKDSLSGSYVIAAGTRVIAACAFEDCTSLTGISMPLGVINIGKDAFYNCCSLASVTIPEGVKSIGENAFSYCNTLENITIPSSVAYIGEYAFFICTSLKSITVDSANNYYSSDEFGVLFNKDKTFLIHYPKGNGRASYQIPEGVESIEYYAFADCTSLISVTIPSSLNQIGYQLFFGCNFLSSVTIPEGVTSIEDGAFKDCTSLANISIPSSVTSIGKDAFLNCAYYNNAANWTSDVLYLDNCLLRAKDTLFGSYTVSAGTRVIAKHAFDGCASLISVTILEGVTSIGKYAFSSWVELIVLMS